MIAQVKGYKKGKCGHPYGPDSNHFAPELCCPDNLLIYKGTEECIVHCGERCVHNNNHKEK